MEDGQIIELYWSRSERAIVETDARYGKYCYAIAYNILSSTEDSAECVNDTWLGAWRSMPPKRPSCLAAFLGRLTRNLALNRWRSRRAEKRGGGRCGGACGGGDGRDTRVVEWSGGPAPAAPTGPGAQQ